MYHESCLVYLTAGGRLFFHSMWSGSFLEHLSGIFSSHYCAANIMQLKEVTKQSSMDFLYVPLRCKWPIMLWEQWAALVWSRETSSFHVQYTARCFSTCQRRVLCLLNSISFMHQHHKVDDLFHSLPCHVEAPFAVHGASPVTNSLSPNLLFSAENIDKLQYTSYHE